MLFLQLCKPCFQTIVTELIQTQNFNKSPIIAGTTSDLPIAVEPIEAQTIIDMPDDAENESQYWFINYGKEPQGYN